MLGWLQNMVCFTQTNARSFNRTSDARDKKWDPWHYGTNGILKFVESVTTSLHWAIKHYLHNISNIQSNYKFRQQVS